MRLVSYKYVDILKMLFLFFNQVCW